MLYQTTHPYLRGSCAHKNRSANARRLFQARFLLAPSTMMAVGDVALIQEAARRASSEPPLGTEDRRVPNSPAGSGSDGTIVLSSTPTTPDLKAPLTNDERRMFGTLRAASLVWIVACELACVARLRCRCRLKRDRNSGSSSSRPDSDAPIHPRGSHWPTPHARHCPHFGSRPQFARVHVACSRASAASCLGVHGGGAHTPGSLLSRGPSHGGSPSRLSSASQVELKFTCRVPSPGPLVKSPGGPRSEFPAGGLTVRDPRVRAGQVGSPRYR